jgi:hypothetical protein
MPSPPKGPRLWLRKERRDRDGAVVRPAVYLIRDGGYQRSTGCGRADLRRAEEALAFYIGEKRLTPQGPRDPGAIPLVDVLALYARDIVPRHARPHETQARIDRLLAYWADKMLSAVTGARCRAYVRSRDSDAAARRELEELRAAINHHRREGFCEKIVSVVLPERHPRRERWLRRSEVAKLLLAAWRYREVQKGHSTGRHSRRHVARFILVALYTGTRAATVCAAALGPCDGRGHIDLERGIFYRRPVGARETKKRRPPVPRPSPPLETQGPALRC